MCSILAERQSRCSAGPFPQNPGRASLTEDFVSIALLRSYGLCCQTFSQVSGFAEKGCSQAGQEDDEFEQEAVDSEAKKELEAAFPEAAVLLQRVQKGVPKSAPADSLYARCRLHCTPMLTPLPSHSRKAEPYGGTGPLKKLLRGTSKLTVLRSCCCHAC